MIKKYFVKQLATIRFILVIGVFVLMLSACSPHPGAGNWEADGKNTLNIAQINITFEGTADFFLAGKDDSIRRCFWSAAGERTLHMQCVHSDQTDLKENYQFLVSETGQAQLSQNEQLIGRFKKSTPKESKQQK